MTSILGEVSGASPTGPIVVFIPAGLSFTSTTWQRTTSSASCPPPRLLLWGAVGEDGGLWPIWVQGEAELGSQTNGSCCFLQPDEKQKAAQQFSKLLAAMKVMGISGDEQKAFWLILGAIYHLGAAGATKGNKLGAVNEGRFETDGCGGFQRHLANSLPCSPALGERVGGCVS